MEIVEYVTRTWHLSYLTEEELDLIINYDIKYRMGDELESQE